MGQPATKLYSVPQVCNAAERIMAIHSEIEREPIPFETTVAEVPACVPPFTAEPACAVCGV